MPKIMVSGLLLALLLLIPALAEAERIEEESFDRHPLYILAKKAADFALKKLDLEKRQDLLIITNAGYVRLGDYGSSIAIDGLRETGCTVGNGRLIPLHSARNQPLYFFFFDGKENKGVYLEVNSGVLRKVEKGWEGIEINELLSRAVFENIGSSKLLNNPEEWHKKVKEKIFGGDEFSIITVGNLWKKNLPQELINSAQFHNHICPGLIIGYIISQFLLEKLPLYPDESYYIIASPIYCKDDAIQVIIDTTVGKQGMASIPLSREDKDCLIPEAKNVAGIYFKFNKKTGKGRGMAVAFDWDKLSEDSGIDITKGFPWESRLKLNLWMIDNLKECRKYVSVISEFELEKGVTPQDYVRAGVNPWEKVGLWRKECKR